MMRRFSPPEIVFNYKYAPFPNLKYVAIFLFVIAFALPYRASTPSDPFDFTVWLCVGLFTSFLVVLYLMLVRRKWSKKDLKKIPLNRLLAYGAFAGTFKGALTEYLVNIFTTKDKYPWDEILLRGYSGTFLALGITFGFALFSSYHLEVSEQRRSLAFNNDQLAKEVATIGEEIEYLKNVTKEEIVTYIQSQLIPLLKFGPQKFDQDFDWKKLSYSLRENITAAVRRESHEIRKLPRLELGFSDHLNKVLKFKVLNLHSRVFALIQFSIGATVVYQDWNPKNSIINLLAHTVVTLIVTYFLAESLKKRKNPSDTVRILYFLALITLHSIFYTLADFILWNNYSIYFQLSTTAWHIFLVLAISLVSEIIQYKDSSKQLELSMSSDLGDKKRILLNQFRFLSDEISKHLHGFLINKIHATANKLDAYAVKGDFGGYKETLDELLEEFSIDSLMKGFEGDSLDRELIESFSTNWDGLIQVQCVFDDSVLTGFHKAQRIELAHVVEELISNAFRRGGAQLIHINFSRDDDGKLEITATDNGVGLGSSQGVGLGSLLFARASDGRWSMKNNPTSGLTVSLIISPYERESEVLAITARE